MSNHTPISSSSINDTTGCGPVLDDRTEQAPPGQGPSSGVRTDPRQTVFLQSPLILSATAPPAYHLSSPTASRPHINGRFNGRQLGSIEDAEAFPIPPEVVETRRREKECSACCLRLIVVITTLRWMLVFTALLGACCVILGIAFGVMSSALEKNAFFVLAFSCIGLGIILVVVVGVGWKCTPPGHEPCHSLCNLTQLPSDPSLNYDDTETTRARRLWQRNRNQWFGGFLYPEYRYGTPPPSYSTSMHQYQQQMQRRGTTEQSIISTSSFDNLSSLPSSPPPTYRSRVANIRIRPPISDILSPSSVEQPPPYRSSSNLEDLVEDAADPAGQAGDTPSFSNVSTSHQDVPADNSGESNELRLNPPLEIHGTSRRQTENADATSFPPLRQDPQTEPSSVSSMVQRFEDLSCSDEQAVTRNMWHYTNSGRMDSSAESESCGQPNAVLTSISNESPPLSVVCESDELRTPPILAPNTLSSQSYLSYVNQSESGPRKNTVASESLSTPEESNRLSSHSRNSGNFEISLSTTDYEALTRGSRLNFSRCQSLDDNEPGQSGI